MCKIYDSIYELAKHMESNILICNVFGMRIEGELHKCDCFTNDCKCFEDVVTLKNAMVTYMGELSPKEIKWINISAKHIQSFAFKCCEK